MGNKSHARLRNLRDVQIYLAKLINRRERNEIDSDLCRDLGYLCRIIMDAIVKNENEEIKKRLDWLEEKVFSK